MHRYEVRAYAIVSADGMIANANGEMPAELRNEADWAYFQSQLDESHLVLVGRRSHEAAPSTGRRQRVVMSRSVASPEQRGGVWWWNPSVLPLATLLSQLLPSGGRVAVPGGQGVFDFLAQWRAIDQFHMSQALSVRLPGGLPAFSAQSDGTPLEQVLGQQGLRPEPPVTVDHQAPVVLRIWRREGLAVDA